MHDMFSTEKSRNCTLYIFHTHGWSRFANNIQLIFLVGVNFSTTVRDRLDVAALSDLSSSLVLLADHAFWSDDNIISVIDEIIGKLRVQLS